MGFAIAASALLQAAKLDGIGASHARVTIAVEGLGALEGAVVHVAVNVGGVDRVLEWDVVEGQVTPAGPRHHDPVN